MHVLAIHVIQTVFAKLIPLMDRTLVAVLPVLRESIAPKMLTNVNWVRICVQDVSYSKSPNLPIHTGSPCEYNGFCVNLPGSFRCSCFQGFTGPRCETNINECESFPCQNDGTCLDEPGAFRCICVPGMLIIFLFIHIS